jgi:tellurite resistance protein TerC
MITIPGVDPIFVWIGFFALVFIILALDLGVFHRKAKAVSVKEALLWAGAMFVLAMLFAFFLWQDAGHEAGLSFITGYLVELSLSVDNLFVFILIFTTFNIHPKFQHRVLFWGILGALIMRGLFIGLGSALVQKFDWIFFIFGAVLLYGAYRMQFGKEEKFDPEKSFIVRFARKIFPVAHRPDEHHFFTKENGKRAITTLFLALIVIEVSDIIFATDSIPAIFAITTDPFIVFTSNIFAILGLRSMYFVLQNLHDMFAYLKTGVAIILLFIAVKLIIFKWYHFPILFSLGFIVTVLLLAIVTSLIFKKKVDTPELPKL